LKIEKKMTLDAD